MLDVYSNGSSVMNVGGDGKLTVNGGVKAKSINPFAGNASGTYYANFSKSGKHKYWHIIFDLQKSYYNLQN